MIVKRDRIKSNRALRDENIQIAEERGQKPASPDEVHDLGVTASEIRRKLRRKHGETKKDRQACEGK